MSGWRLRSLGGEVAFPLAAYGVGHVWIFAFISLSVQAALRLDTQYMRPPLSTSYLAQPLEYAGNILSSNCFVMCEQTWVGTNANGRDR